MIRFILVSCLIFLLSGCSSQPSIPRSEISERQLYAGLVQLEKNSRYDEQPSNVILAQSARSVSHTLQDLARIQRSVHQLPAIKEDPSLLKINIQGRTSVNWTGPVDSILSQIAKTYKKKLVIFGNRPPLPIIVSIDRQNIAVADLIREIAYLTQNQVSITYANQTIELRYR